MIPLWAHELLSFRPGEALHFEARLPRPHGMKRASIYSTSTLSPPLAPAIPRASVRSQHPS